MICTINLLRELESKNKINAINNQEINVNSQKTPDWIKIKSFNINPENNEKLSNKSLNYAIVAKTSGKNRHRLTISKNL